MKNKVKHHLAAQQKNAPPLPIKTQIVQFIQNHALDLFLLFFLTILAYGFVVNGPFVSDDIDGILKSREIRMWLSPFSSTRGLLWNYLLVIFYHIFGPQPWVYRGFNILIHTSNVLLVYVLAFQLSSKRRIALFTAAIFSVHPLLIESVSWISGGSYSLYAFFLFISLILYITYQKTERTRFWIISIVAFIFAALSSERSVMFAGIVALYALSFRKKKDWISVVPYFIIAAAGIVIFGLDIYTRIQHVQMFKQVNTVSSSYILTPVSIIWYFYYFFLPIQITLYHAEALTDTLYITSILVSLAFVALIGFMYFKNRKLFFALGFYLIAITPMILPLRIASTVAERYIYFASFGLFFAVVYLFDAFCTWIKNKMAYTLTAFIIILLLFIRTIDRNMDWNDYTRFWEHEANTSLVTFQTHYNLGVTYRNQKRYEEALVEFQKSLMLKQDFPQTYFDYALTYQMMNKFPEAIENYLLAIKVDPYSRGSYNNLALISLQQKKYEDAITYMKAALGKFPRDPELYTNLGIVYYNVGDVNNARSSFKAALSIDPNYTRAISALTELDKK